MYMIYLGGRVAKMMKKKEEEVIRRGTRKVGVAHLCPQSICATPTTHTTIIYIYIYYVNVCV